MQHDPRVAGGPGHRVHERPVDRLGQPGPPPIAETRWLPELGQHDQVVTGQPAHDPHDPLDPVVGRLLVVVRQLHHGDPHAAHPRGPGPARRSATRSLRPARRCTPPARRRRRGRPRGPCAWPPGRPSGPRRPRCPGPAAATARRRRPRRSPRRSAGRTAARRPRAARPPGRTTGPGRSGPAWWSIASSDVELISASPKNAWNDSVTSSRTSRSGYAGRFGPGSTPISTEANR